MTGEDSDHTEISQPWPHHHQIQYINRSKPSKTMPVSIVSLQAAWVSCIQDTCKHGRPAHSAHSQHTIILTDHLIWFFFINLSSSPGYQSSIRKVLLFIFYWKEKKEKPSRLRVTSCSAVKCPSLPATVDTQSVRRRDCELNIIAEWGINITLRKYINSLWVYVW